MAKANAKFNKYICWDQQQSETHTNAEGLQREHWFGIICGKDFCGTRVEVRWPLGTQGI